MFRLIVHFWKKKYAFHNKVNIQSILKGQKRGVLLEQQPCRHEESHSNMRFFSFIVKGVAGIVFPTQVVLPNRSDFYLSQPRDEHGWFTK